MLLTTPVSPPEPDFVVDITADESDGNHAEGDLSLREAIELSNAMADQQVIGFASALGGETIQLDGSHLQITDDVIILGLAADDLTIDANGQSRVFLIDSGGIANIRDLTITGGTLPQDLVQHSDDTNSGGGILNRGVLTIERSTLSGNAALRGGGIYSSGTLAITDSLLQDNQAERGGGGILVSDGFATVSTTTFDGNRSTESGGGAIFASSRDQTVLESNTFVGNSSRSSGGGLWTANGSVVSVVNSTFVANYTDLTAGGAISSNGATTIANSTIAGNHAGRDVTGNQSFVVDHDGDGANASHPGAVGGGIALDSSFGMLVLNNSVVAGNHAGSQLIPNDIEYDNNQMGDRLSASHSLIGDAATAAGLMSGVNSNIVGSGGPLPIDIASVLFDADADGQITRVDLLDFSGQTRTIAPALNSPAVDAGDDSLAVDADGAPLEFDQRGQRRFRDGNADQVSHVDIGACEDPNLIVVNTAVDVVDANDGVTSLREAVSLTHATVGDDRIHFAPALSGSTITLGGTDLDIGGTVFIHGPGQGSLTIDGDETSRHFAVGDLDRLTIAGVTLTRGRSSQPDLEPFGGASILNFGVLNLSQSRVTDNLASGHVGDGAIETFFGESTILASMFDLNESNDGGALWGLASSVTVIDSVFESNTANGGFGGGAIYSANDFGVGGTLTISGSTFTDNSAVPNGGAIHSRGTDTTISDSSFSGNEAGLGGAVFTTSGPLAVEDSTFSGNRAFAGGAIFTERDSFDIRDTTFTGNAADIDPALSVGGALAAAHGASGLVVNSTFDGNEAGAAGGAIDGNNAELTIVGSTISRNHATFVSFNGNATAAGGGISTLNGSLNLINSTVSGNSASGVGGGVSLKFTPSSIVSSTITGNHSNTDDTELFKPTTGGGLFIDGGDATLSNSIIAGNFKRTDRQPDDIGSLGGSLIGMNSLIGDADTAFELMDGVDGNIVGVDGVGVRPVTTILDPELRNNGGLTMTHALVFRSPAIDAGSNALAVDASGSPLEFDQRGAEFPRIVDGSTDLGAVEGDIRSIQSFDASSGTLTIGVAGDSDLGIDAAAGIVRVFIDGQLQDDIQSVAAADVRSVIVQGGDGRNQIDLSAVGPADFSHPDGVEITVNGGDGNDRLTGSQFNDRITGGGGTDNILGGPGNDTLNGGGGLDYLNGGEGNDRLRGQGSSGDRLIGGEGDDYLDGGSGNDLIAEVDFAGDVTLTNSSMTGLGTDVVVSVERALFVGSNASQTIDVSEFFTPGLTSTTLKGLGGDDTIFGSPGADIVAGFGGDDFIDAGTGKDRLFGGSGADTLLGGDGNDLLKGQGGSGDRLSGGAGDDLLIGGRGIDRLVESGDVDFTLMHSSMTGLGTDVVRSIEIAELNGGPSDNTIDVSEFPAHQGFTLLRGNGGNDLIIGSIRKDVLNGGDGNDTLLGKGGNDTLNGGAGADRLSGFDGNDLLRGGDFHDIGYGGNGNDTLEGERGVDILFGGDGDDSISGGNGPDTLIGGQGDNDPTPGSDSFANSAEVDEAFTIDPLQAWVDQV